MPEEIQVGVQFPGEAFACKLMDLIMKVMDGQPPEVRKQLWEWYVEDVRAWRKFWGKD